VITIARYAHFVPTMLSTYKKFGVGSQVELMRHLLRK